MTTNVAAAEQGFDEPTQNLREFIEASELEAAVGQAIEACGGDPVATVRALIVANALLENELATLYAKSSKGYLRGRRVTPRSEVQKS